MLLTMTQLHVSFSVCSPWCQKKKVVPRIVDKQKVDEGLFLFQNFSVSNDKAIISVSGNAENTFEMAQSQSLESKVTAR